MRIVQIAPEIGPGTGVAGVAHALEREWQAAGVDVDRFTMSEAHGDWLPARQRGIQGHLAHLVRVLWFSLVGTVAARRYLARNPDTIAVCHNDALAGDVYVNHGILEEAMRARGRFLLRMVRNPLHLVTWLRDRGRYGTRCPHRLVVNLSSQDDAALHRLHPHLSADTAVIGNGVDIERFTPATPPERDEQRCHLGLSQDDTVVAFVGHEFDRKGLTPLVRAVAMLPLHVHLVVVGGTPDMVERAKAGAAACGSSGRVHFVGTTTDPRPYLRAADLFALPSAYEAYPLVVLEALACGLPVIATETGPITDLIEDGRNGWKVDATASSIARAVTAYLASDTASMRDNARRTAEVHTWTAVSVQYLQLLARLSPTTDSTPT